MPIKVGEEALICLGKDSKAGFFPKYSECEFSYKARIVGTIRKMPMIYDISGYSPAAFLSPGVIITNN